MPRKFKKVIGTNAFNQTFKAPLRDFYTYGFKSSKDFPQSDSTLKGNWELINEIICNQWIFPSELDENKGLVNGKQNEKKSIILKTGGRSVTNPFDVLYRHHNIGIIGEYLNYLLELDPDVSLAEDFYSNMGIDGNNVCADYGGIRPLMILKDKESENAEEYDQGDYIGYVKEGEEINLIVRFFNPAFDKRMYCVQCMLPQELAFQYAGDGGSYDTSSHKVLWQVEVDKKNSKDLSLKVKVKNDSGCGDIKITSTVYDSKDKQEIKKSNECILCFGRKKIEKDYLINNFYRLEKAYMFLWNVENEQRERKTSILVRTNNQLAYLTPPKEGTREKDKYKNISNRMKTLEALGIVYNIADGNHEEIREKWKQEVWQQGGEIRKKSEIGYKKDEEIIRGSRKNKKKDSKVPLWVKSPLTMKAFLKAVCNEKSEMLSGNTINFQVRLWDFLVFYSHFFVLGEVGEMLLERLKACCPHLDSLNPVFQFKHHYFIREFCDYDITDLWKGITQRAITYIRYSHGINKKETEIVGVPLQIRISVANGREYVLLYCLYNNEIEAVRIDFIDEIMIFSDGLHKVTLEMQDGDNKTEMHDLYCAEGEKDCSCLNRKMLNHKVDIAQNMIGYLWGVENPHCKVEEEFKKNLVDYRIHLRYDREKEYYIDNRLEKEKRIGKIIATEDGAIVQIRCFSTKELRTWIRTFYNKIISVSGMDTCIEKYNVDQDVIKMNSLYQEECDDSFMTAIYKFDGYDKYDKKLEKKKMPELEGHASVFNELFSVYAEALGDALLKENKGDRRSFTRRLKKTVDDEVEAGTICELARKSGLIHTKENLVSKYGNLKDVSVNNRFVPQKNNMTYLGHLLPITKIECNWLFAALSHPFSQIFFQDLEEIQKLKNILMRYSPFQISGFSETEDKIPQLFYYDQYDVGEQKESYIKNLNIAYTTIRRADLFQGEILNVTSLNSRGVKMSPMDIKLSFIEYSCRDNLFRLCGWNEDRKNHLEINVNRICGTISKQGGENYRLPDIREQVEACLKKEKQYIKILFTDNMNVPDRILTEFSLWEKSCSYDYRTGKYLMTIIYPKSDIKELVIRLMSYGAHIKVLKPVQEKQKITNEYTPGWDLYEEIRGRINDQMQLFEKLKK